MSHIFRKCGSAGGYVFVWLVVLIMGAALRVGAQQQAPPQAPPPQPPEKADLAVVKDGVITGQVTRLDDDIYTNITIDELKAAGINDEDAIQVTVGDTPLRARYYNEATFRRKVQAGEIAENKDVVAALYQGPHLAVGVLNGAITGQITVKQGMTVTVKKAAAEK
jgi:S-adenosylmethionine hydrolase